MTVETQINKVIANGNGVATSFSFGPMVIEASDELLVVKRASNGTETTLSEGSGTSDYSVVVASYPGTGSITFPASGSTKLATGEKLAIVRRKTLKQTTDLENQGGYFAETQELQFDRLVMIDLQQQEQIDRALKIGTTDNAGANLTVPALEASKVLGVNSGGDGLVWLTLTSSVVGVSAFGLTLLDDANAATARTTLGVSIGSDVQAWNAKLDALAALTWAANKMPYFTSASAVATADITSGARTALGQMSNVVVQRVRSEVTSVGNSTTAVPIDNTKPQQSGPEGAQITSVSITPKSASNKLRVRAGGFFSQTIGSTARGALVLYRDSTADAIAAVVMNFVGSDNPIPGYIECVVDAGSVSATTFKFWAGPGNGADNLRWGGTSVSTLFGGVGITWLEVEEFTP